VQPSLPFDASPAPGSDGPGGRRAAGRAQDLLEPTFVRHPRARRYVVRVLRDGSVRVTVPRWGSKREARAFAAEQSAWIERERARLARARAEGGATPAEIAALRARAAHELPPRLREIAAEHGLRVARISVRDQRWRWGSCSRGGHICLNWRLVAMPPEVRDYVIVPRADAPEADGSLAGVLGSRRRRVPRLSGGARLAPRPRGVAHERLKTRPKSSPKLGSPRVPPTEIGTTVRPSLRNNGSKGFSSHDFQPSVASDNLASITKSPLKSRTSDRSP
jgi:hypothetical protein